MGNNIKKQTVQTVGLYGRTFTITQTLWTNSDGVSYDVTDEATGFALHDESFDTCPTPAEITNLIDRLIEMNNSGEIPPGETHFWDSAEVQTFLSSLTGWVKISLNVENSYERYPDVTIEHHDKFIPAPPNYEADWEIVTGIDGTQVATGTAYVYALDKDDASSKGQAEAHTHPRYDERIQPQARLIEVRALDITSIDGDSEELNTWSYDHLRTPFTGAGHEDGQSWYDVTVTACSMPELIGKTFSWGY